MKKMLVLALVLAAAPVVAQAAPMSYTYVEGGYNRLHLDDNEAADVTADGAYLRGSYDFAETGVNVFGSVSKVSDTENFVTGERLDIDLRQDELGVGYHQAFSERVDFIAEAAWVRQTLDVQMRDVAGAEFSDSAHGGRGSIGVRGQFNDVVEGLLKVNYYAGGDFEGDTFTGTAGAQFRINPTWGINAEVETGEIDDVQTTRYVVGVRASF